MKVLLDTHAFPWAVLEPHKLSARARALLENTETKILVSAASAWEIVSKFRIGRLLGAASVMADYAGAVSGLAAQTLPITNAHALISASAIRSTACWRRRRRSKVCRSSVAISCWKRLASSLFGDWRDVPELWRR